MSPRRARAVAGRVGEDPASALREHLLDTAERLLGERQVSAITTRDIAVAAQVSEGVLYNYFSDKHDLLLAAMLRRYDGLMARFVACLPQAGMATVEENLQSLAAAALQLQSGVLPLMTGLITEPSLLQRFIGEMHERPLGPERTMQWVGDYIDAERRLGRVGADVEPGPFNTLLMGATSLLAFTGMLSVGDTPQQVTGELASIVRALIRGLAP
jgi:AcrR family transcriptional regulator